MLRDRLVPGVTTIVLLLCVSSLSVSAQKKPTQSPDQKPRKVRVESDRAFKDWPKEVDAIITGRELEAYRKLDNNEERQHFIEIFWDRRDPDPDTQENEYKEEYYERLAYANEHFASGKPGSMTDRGRMYLKWGKPDSIESHPSGGSYDRSADEGGGSTTVYPFEKWFYRSLSIDGLQMGPTVRSGVEIEFVDPTGTGEYRIARGPDEKDALLMVPGAGQTLDELLGFRDKSERIAGAGGFGQANYRSQRFSPFEMMDLIKDMNGAPAVRGTVGDTTVNDSPKIEDSDPLNFDLAVHFFRQSDTQGIAAFAIQTNNKDLVFKDSGGLQTARLNIFARIISVTNRRVGKFEDSVITTVTPLELTDAKERKSIYGKAVSLAPGIYRADVTVRDVVTGATGTRRYAFTVPKYEAGKLAASSIILAAKLEKLGEQPAAGQFIIGQTKVVPNISAVYRRGEPLGLYLQVYNAGTDQTTLRPAVGVEYVLLKDGRELSRQAEDWRGIGNTTERLILTRLIDTRPLETGQYEIQIRIHDQVNSQMLAPSAKFTIK
jgi:GWxTD domain-containing protein